MLGKRYDAAVTKDEIHLAAERQIRRLVEECPPLSDEQRVRLAAMFAPVSVADRSPESTRPTGTPIRPVGQGRTYLYRFFDAAGALLYVGIAANVEIRMSTHERTSAWFARASRVTVALCVTRDDALALEALAIASEAPEYNRQRTRSYRPVPHYRPEQLEDQRLTRYLATARYFAGG